jgi:hypothetical protein
MRKFDEDSVLQVQAQINYLSEKTRNRETVIHVVLNDS